MNSGLGTQQVSCAAGEKIDPGEQAALPDGACGENSTLRGGVEALPRIGTKARSLPLEGAVAGDPAETVANDPNATIPQTGPVADANRGNRDAHACTEQLGQMIGRYKLLQLIGEGGFGSVFVAEQEQPVRRRVALKIIKLGMDTKQVVARFEQERQALALMDHPNIAKVLDAGATDSGRPYFVMELVQGERLTDYCDRHKLDPTQRLGLFQQVCHAVQHAHQKGIIHRDIKPSNVLVAMADGKPIPKVIDFGIAKATAARLTENTVFTEQGQMIGTPQYMSPEQAEGLPDIDTRTDVYSLGVLLYELLTGVTPFDLRRLRSAAYHELQRIIREEEPPKPSTRLSTLADLLTGIAAVRSTDPVHLTRAIRGELDWIVMKAMEKDRARRYETANSLADDVARHLSAQPVLAAPPDTVYLLRKFMLRHRSASIAVGSLLVIILSSLSYCAFMWGVAAKAEARQTSIAKAATAKAMEMEKLADESAREIGRQRLGWFLLEWHAGRIVAAQHVRDRFAPRSPEYSAMQFLLDPSKSIEQFGAAMPPDTEALTRFAVGERYMSTGRLVDAAREFNAVLDAPDRPWLKPYAEARLDEIRQRAATLNSATRPHESGGGAP